MTVAEWIRTAASLAFVLVGLSMGVVGLALLFMLLSVRWV